MKIKTIFFDYGRVIANFDFDIFAKEMKPFSPLTPRKILDKISTGSAMCRYQKGSISSRDFFNSFKKELKISNLSYARFKQAWNSMLSVPDDRIEKVLSRIRPEIKMLILSTNNDLHWKFHSKNAPVLRKYFPHSRQRVLSHRVGASKPERKIFEAALSRFHNHPSETIFVDDNKEYLKVFRKMGGNAIYYDCRIHSEKYLLEKLSQFNVIKTSLD